MRLDGRSPGDIRPLHFTRHWLPTLPGSVLVDCGLTRVLCTAVVEDGVPPFLKNTDQGWVTAEYSMLPASTNRRKQRDRAGKVDGRSVEIQRLIGRALRAIVDRRAIKGRTIWVDCDVLAADGGTRTTAINGAYVAMHDALSGMLERGDIKRMPLKDSLQAISVGIVDDTPMADLSYYEDSSAAVDMNLIMTGKGEVVEMGGGAEQGTFALDALHELIELGQGALARVRALQEEALAK
ncbi:MAG: ribonuclease PH [Planctomycetota bacterium]|nr:MAG: ribonuclease PH [Planctomycetota bacterium]